MIKSIGFVVNKWDYHPEIEIIKPKTNIEFGYFPVITKDSKEAEGLAFKWKLEIVSEKGIVLEYESTEMFLISNKNISNNELGHVALQSYRKTKEEVSMRNAVAGLNATFWAFEKIGVHKHYSSLRRVLNTKY